MLESVKKWSTAAPFFNRSAHERVSDSLCTFRKGPCLQRRARVKKCGSGLGGGKGQCATSRLYVLPRENRLGWPELCEQPTSGCKVPLSA